uniref:Uncharacterized protein n=1 Tax=Arundo donax TaxID=35708 RepID=A0A0A9ENR0_ARUDO
MYISSSSDGNATATRALICHSNHLPASGSLTCKPSSPLTEALIWLKRLC